MKHQVADYFCSGENVALLIYISYSYFFKHKNIIKHKNEHVNSCFLKKKDEYLQ